MMKNVFNISSSKLFLFSRYLNFCLEFLVMKKNGLIRKDKVILKIYDIATWLKNNQNTHTAQYLTKERQPNDKIWPVNRI